MSKRTPPTTETPAAPAEPPDRSEADEAGRLGFVDAAAANDAGEQIVILSKAKAGFRRGGVAHQPGVTVWPADSFTPDQIAQIEADPLFEVRHP